MVGEPSATRKLEEAATGDTMLVCSVVGEGSGTSGGLSEILNIEEV